jgi:hypothetical protein
MKFSMRVARALEIIVHLDSYTTQIKALEMVECSIVRLHLPL